MKKIILCADDYGYNEPISQGILKLAQKQRISAISCMVTAPNWNKYAKLIQNSNVALGLHLDLTEFNKYCSLKKLILRANLRLINKEKISEQIINQLLLFKQTFHSEPQFIDGHQHVHQLPVISDILLHIYHDLTTKPYIRYINTTFTPLKQLIIAGAGDLSFRTKLKALKIPYNNSFAGIYSFSKHSNYTKLFPQFLRRIKNNGLIMCHPGLSSDDPIAYNRQQEYNYLNSDNFIQDLAHNNVELCFPGRAQHAAPLR